MPLAVAAVPMGGLATSWCIDGDHRTLLITSIADSFCSNTLIRVASGACAPLVVTSVGGHLGSCGRA